jgi:ABC-type phosphate transport system permease subunit
MVVAVTVVPVEPVVITVPVGVGAALVVSTLPKSRLQVPRFKVLPLLHGSLKFWLLPTPIADLDRS